MVYLVEFSFGWLLLACASLLAAAAWHSQRYPMPAYLSAVLSAGPSFV